MEFGNNKSSLIPVILISILAILIICWLYSRYYLKAESFSQCGFEKGTVEPININEESLKDLFINLNGVTYTWNDSPITIRLNNFDFDRHSVDVIINEGVPNAPPVQCKTINATQDTITVEKAYLDHDITYHMIDDAVYINTATGSYKLYTK